ncbi:MAG: efflux transporter outer membrane subunit, partial [Verrucomicrobiota bacterium]
MNKISTWVAFIAVTVTGCTLAPKYHQPAAPVAQTWPENSNANNHSANTNAVADIGWREFFNDARLQQLIGLALTNNRDLRVAVLNVEVAQAQYRIARSDLYPQINATGSFVREKTPGFELIPGVPSVNDEYSVGIGTASYELDLFGRVRSLKKQALENYFATGEAQRNAHILLVSEVAVQYLTSLEFDEQLAVARQTLDSVQSAYDLNKQSYDAGNISELDLRTAEAQVETAKVAIANYEQLRNQSDDALVLLLGGPIPANLPPAQSLNSEKLLTDLPPGLPSDLLQRRPDILEAEHQLEAANANIGAARAAFFPTISITANAGFSSLQLAQLFATGSGNWLFNPQITLPIFTAGQNKANPLGAIGSVAAMLEYSFGLAEEAAAVNRAMEQVLNSGKVTADLHPAALALAAAGMLWIAWPKKSSKVPTDLTEDVIRLSGLDAGLVDIKVCAV